MYQRVGASAYRADLENTHKLAIHLSHPETSFKSIHVAGTNGKGSTCHMLASILQEAGYKTGLYTSPHLKDFRERIRINGRMISKKTVTAFVKNNKEFFEENHLSFFEMTVGLAFDCFRSEKVDIAVIEVGMGGRLDSTNIITPEVSVISNIGLDHTKFLGNTLQQIAEEKAGIIKPNIPVVIGESQRETTEIFLIKAKKSNAPIVFADTKKTKQYKSDLMGIYQERNKKTVLATIESLKKGGWKISEANIRDGIANTVKNTGLLGRWQILRDKPKVICDTAHNKEGLQLVIGQLLEQSFQNLHIVMGVVNDKDLSAVLPLFPKTASFYFCKPDVPRGLDAGLLAEEALKYNLKGEIYLSVEMAYKDAVRKADKEDLIFVGGSTFVVAEVL